MSLLDHRCLAFFGMGLLAGFCFAVAFLGWAS